MATATELNINTAATADDMFASIFGDGIQVVAGTATYRGDAASSGTYSGALSTLGDIVPTDTGVILSTGNVADFTNSSGTSDTNVNAGTGSDVTGGVDGDAQLNAVSGQDTFDGAILEADFIPTGDMLTMQFVFSSEEYPEYVNGGVNDSFGVWINGQFVEATISVAGNISIDSVNAGANQNLYRDNTADQYNTEMDGFTYVLSFKAPVNAGAVNHIKIGIADGGDAVYDSNLLIMGDSIQTYALAMDDKIQLTPNSSRTFDILANDRDETDGGLTITHLNGTAVVAGQTVTLSTGEQVRLNADGTVTVFSDGDVGSNALNYTIVDGEGNTDVGFITIETVSATGPDGIVEGSTGADVIDAAYLGDPDGDRIDNNDGQGVAGTVGDADYIMAGAGNDSITAGAANDIIYGGAGDDTALGGDGDDWASLGDGNDSFDANGSGNDTVYGDAGNDDIIGGGGNDIFYGGADNDHLRGNGGNDTLYGDEGNDTVCGSFGNDTLYGGAGSDSIEGEEDADTIYGGAGDTVVGGEGGTDNDTLVLAYADVESITYGGGNNEAGTVTFSAASGGGTLTFSEIENITYAGPVDGTAGDDTMGVGYTDAQGDIIDGADGDNDTIFGNGGNDGIQDGAGDDVVYGGTGNDALTAGAGNDLLKGGDGADRIYLDLASGNDTVVGGESTQAGVDDSDVLYVTSGSSDVTIQFTGDEAGTVSVGGTSASFSEFETYWTEAGNDTVNAGASAVGVQINTGTGNDSVTGGSGNDGIYTADGADEVFAGAGDDTVSGWTGADQLYAGDGNDQVYGGADNDYMQGDAGDDTVQGGEGDDFIRGDAGNDVVAGGDGNDSVYGGADSDTIYGGAGDDQIFGGYGDDIVYGGLGNDSVTGSGENDVVYGDEGNDSIQGSSGDDTLYGGDGADTLLGEDDADSIYAGSGDLVDGYENVTNGVDNDTLYVTGIDHIDWDVLNPENGVVYYADGSSVNFYNIERVFVDGTQVLPPDYIVEGTAGDDVINGNYAGDPEGDLIDAADNQTGTNDDVVQAGAGNDSVLAGDGADSVDGGDGDDTLVGGLGNDTLTGWNGANQIYGGEGSDYIDAGGGSGAAAGDTIYAGTGNDSVYGDDGNDLVYLEDGDDSFGTYGSESAGDDTVYGGAGNDTILDGSGNNLIEGGLGNDALGAGNGNDSIYGGDGDDAMYGDISGAGNDLLDGGAGNDTGLGGDGNDTLYGYDGNDSLSGEAGDDALYGGLGDDYLDGDAGNDLFQGYLGNDTLVGDAGADSMDGGAGDDQLYAGADDDFVQGGDGNDQLYGAEGNDTLWSGVGNDTLNGGAGNDDMIGEDGDDRFVLENGFGDDTIAGSEAGETSGDTLDLAALTGAVTVDLTNVDPEAGTVNQGTDTATFTQIENIVLGDATETIVLADGSGADTVTGFEQPTDNGDGTYTGVDQLDVSGLTDAGGNPVNVADVTVSDDGNGNAVLTFPNGESLTLIGVPVSAVSTADQLEAMGIPAIPLDYVVEGSAGDDVIDGSYLGDPEGDQVDNLDAADGSNNDLIEAYGGNDSISAGNGDDTIYAGTGDDSANGGSGTDLVYGGDGNDDLNAGGDGEDTLSGELGNDTLTSTTGNDVLYGGVGDDSITSGADNDVLDGGDGNDWMSGDTGNDTLSGGLGADSLYGGSGTDSVSGGEGNDDLSAGSDGDDTLSGDLGDDTLTSTVGNDVLYGGDGNDSLSSGADNDLLDGGDGNDWVGGGVGNDTVYGGLGNDSVYGGAGDDLVEGGDGNDIVHGGPGLDTLSGGAGNDTLIGVTEADVMDGGADADQFDMADGFGADTIIGGETGTDNDTLDLSAVTSALTVDLSDANPESGTVSDGTATATFSEIENITLGAGVDTLVLADGSGADTVNGFTAPTDNGDGTYTGVDQLDVSGLTDADGNPVNTDDVTVSDDGNGNAVLTFPNGESLTLIGVDPADVTSSDQLAALGIPYAPTLVVDGTSGDDTMDVGFTDIHGDQIDGSDGDDDTIMGYDGNDSITAGAGNDSVDGGTGNDTLAGDAGNDTLLGADGDDQVAGGTGNDTLTGGDGADSMQGGDDRDTFFGGIGDVVDGGEGGDDVDVLDLTAYGHPATNIIYDTMNPENGTVEFLDANGDVVGTMTFSNIENVVACFTPGAMVATDQGEVAVEDLVPGDRVLTRDNGYQTIRWAGRRDLSHAELIVEPRFNPVFIAAGALGNGLPERDMMVSPQHRMLMAGPRAEVLFGEHEVLVAAKHLVGLPGIEQRVSKAVSYIHILFDAHEIVRADGAWSESFQPGAQTMDGLGNEQRAEILALFPELAAGQDVFPAARMTLKAKEARLLTLA